VRGPRGLALARLDARLEPGAAEPLVVALSGGGDSTALLLIARDWAARHGRRLLALTVDHRLQAAGAGWAQACAGLCARLGVAHRTLVWVADKPDTGLPAAARLARHRLMAEAAREAGARVILLGHTADDVREAAAMRAEGSTVPTPREWSPSPVWPEGRGLFLLRPLLGVSRAALRAFLEAEGEGWIEDPANEDPRYARARARQSLSQSLDLAQLPQAAHPQNPFQTGPGESLVANRGTCLDPAILGAAMLSAGGQSRPARRLSLERLADRLAEPGGVTATLAGARIEADAEQVLIVRDAGEFRRRGLTPQGLEPGRAIVWDGRYEIAAHVPGLSVGPVAGLARRLPTAQQAALRALPAVVRPSLPAVSDGTSVTCPILAADERMTVSGLVFERFCAAIGLFCSEAAIRRVAKTPVSP
jgi:tRNA(Ile)-lysidine synthase